MMARVFVDTNIVLDWLAKREPYFPFARDLFLKAERGEIEILVSTMTYISLEYILRKKIGKEDTIKALFGLRSITKTCSSGEKEIDLAFLSDFSDFEDAVQYSTAVSNKASCVITRNLKDFKKAKLPILTAEQYLKS